MKSLVLVFGNPGQGKSTFAKQLKDECSFEILPTDELYVQFFNDECEDFYFKNLRNYIAQHFKCIVWGSRTYTRNKFGRDLFDEWNQYLFSEVSKMVTQHDRVVVEGYLLEYCLTALADRMSATATVYRVEVQGRQPYLNGTLLSNIDTLTN